MAMNRRKSPRKHRTVAYKGFKLRLVVPESEDTHKTPFWMADNCDRKKRVRASFKTLEEAKLFADQKAVEVENHGRAAYALTPAQRIEAVEAFKGMNGLASLIDAVEFWKQHHPEAGAVTISKLAEDWIEDLAKSGKRARTIREAKHRTVAFVAAMGEATPCASITGESVRQFLGGRPGTKITLNGWRRVLFTWFNFAKRRKILRNNPVEEVDPIKLDEKMPEFMNWRTVARFMSVAERQYPEAIPAFAILFFAGLRPSEVEGQYGISTKEPKSVKQGSSFDGIGARLGGLKWENINLAERIIRVLPETSKNRRTRLVDIPDNLLLWLSKYRHTSGAVSPPPPTLRRIRRRIMQEIGLAKWTPDVTRHSYATFHFAMNQDVAKLQAQMGHTGKSDVLYRHYRGLATRTEADRYWAVAPADVEQGGQVMQLATKGA